MLNIEIPFFCVVEVNVVYTIFEIISQENVKIIPTCPVFGAHVAISSKISHSLSLSQWGLVKEGGVMKQLGRLSI